jgi:hypothetical protein
VDRRFAQGFQLTGSYTWSRNIDNTSEGVGGTRFQSPVNLLVPSSEGGLKLDRGVSDFDRTHRLSILYVWSLPGPVGGVWKYILSGWSLAGITAFQTGAPFTLYNGSDRDGSGDAVTDRPDISNPAKPINSRAILFAGCPTGYQNPDTGVCVSPADVHWIQGTGRPNATTVGRNTLRTGGINNFDLSLSKSFQIAEQKRLEFRWEALNALNHPQFINFPEKDVTRTLPGRFLNRDSTDSGVRSMWVQLKLVF